MPQHASATAASQTSATNRSCRSSVNCRRICPCWLTSYGRCAPSRTDDRHHHRAARRYRRDGRPRQDQHGRPPARSSASSQSPVRRWRGERRSRRSAWPLVCRNRSRTGSASPPSSNSPRSATRQPARSGNSSSAPASTPPVIASGSGCRSTLTRTTRHGKPLRSTGCRESRMGVLSRQPPLRR